MKEKEIEKEVLSVARKVFREGWEWARTGVYRKTVRKEEIDKEGFKVVVEEFFELDLSFNLTVYPILSYKIRASSYEGAWYVTTVSDIVLVLSDRLEEKMERFKETMEQADTSNERKLVIAEVLKKFLLRKFEVRISGTKEVTNIQIIVRIEPKELVYFLFSDGKMFRRFLEFLEDIERLETVMKL